MPLHAPLSLPLGLGSEVGIRVLGLYIYGSGMRGQELGSWGYI